MPDIYEPFGPFEVPRKSNKRIDEQMVKANGPFWDALEKIQPNLSNARGCYIFSIKASQGYRPWYVGQANGEKGFGQEAFHYHKLFYMNEVLANTKRGTPIIHFLALQTESGRISKKKIKKNELDWLETLLIGMALKQNKLLCNIKNKKLHQNVIVPGITGGGGRGGGKRESRQTLKKVLGI